MGSHPCNFLPDPPRGAALRQGLRGFEQTCEFLRAHLPHLPLPHPTQLQRPKPHAAERHRAGADGLRRAKGKKIEAARIRGIDRKRLARKMEKYGLESAK